MSVHTYACACIRTVTHTHVHTYTHTNCLQYTMKVIKLTEENKIKGGIIAHWLYKRLVTEIQKMKTKNLMAI